MRTAPRWRGLDTLGNVQADALPGDRARRLALHGVLLQAAREGTGLSLALLQRFVKIEEAHWARYGQGGVVPRGAKGTGASCGGAEREAAKVGASFRAARQRKASSALDAVGSSASRA